MRSAHAFELDYEFHMWEELSPVILSPHQVYFRIMCGEAAYFQRCHVYMSDMWVPPGWPGDALLGGDQTPRPSDWEKFPVQARPRRYFFHGEHRNPALFVVGVFQGPDDFVVSDAACLCMVDNRPAAHGR